MIKVECDGEVLEFSNEISANEVIKKAYGKKSGAVAALVNDEEKDLSYLLTQNCRVEPIQDNSNEGLYIMRHSCAHLLAQAVTELFPNAKPTIGPPIDDGFYYDFFMDPINEDDLRRIEKLMKKIDSALQKIEDGTYGYCEETGEEIGLKRLIARPIATMTVEAQERHEKQEKIFADD